MTFAVAGDERERRAGAAVHFERERTLKTDLLALEGGAQLAFERGVAGFPQALAGVHATPVDVAVPEAQRRLLAAHRDLVNAAAFLALVGLARVEDHAVAGLERRDEPERNG